MLYSHCPRGGVRERKDYLSMRTAVQRALLAAALACAAALCLSGCGGASTAQAHQPNTIELLGQTFSPTSINIKKGQTITFDDNNSNPGVHILVVGRNGESESEPGAPFFGGGAGHRTDVGSVWTTGAWNRPGTYHVTCTVHPRMNLTITVSG
jgi:plastocyanin